MLRVSLAANVGLAMKQIYYTALRDSFHPEFYGDKYKCDVINASWKSSSKQVLRKV